MQRIAGTDWRGCVVNKIVQLRKTETTGQAQAEEQSPSVAFPADAITGSIGALAYTLAEGTEVPEEFYFAAGLTTLGALCTGRLNVAANVDSEPRLYTVLLGESADVKKSTALRRTLDVFAPLLTSTLAGEMVKILHGVASAEGLGRILNKHKRVLLCYDEMRAFMDKASIQSSTLLAMTASLYEGTTWANPTKSEHHSVEVEDGHLSLLGCCTTETYAKMWTSEAIAIGLPNRLFIIGADRKRKVAWPPVPDQAQIDAVLDLLKEQLAKLPKSYGITPQARARWTEWYESAPPSEHAKRLDGIGFRVMPLLALTMGKQIIDGEVMDALLSILDYEITIRRLTDPIDADDRIARLEQKITRNLKARGSLTRRDLLRHTNAQRDGLWAFDRALAHLTHECIVGYDKTTALYSHLDEEAGE